MALYYDVRVDVSADKVIDSGYHFTQGDSQEIFLRIAVMNGNTKFDGSAAQKVTVNFKKPDFTFVEGVPTLTDDVYLYQFRGNEIQAAGRVIADVKFYYDSGRVSTGMFAFVVDHDTSSDNVIQSSGYIESLEKAKNDADDILAKIRMDENEIDGYVNAAKISADKSKSYAVGDTGTRLGEDTDNAKYYSEQSKNYKDEAYRYTQDFKYTHVKYSANADGTDMTDVPVKDVTVYMGVYAGPSKIPPTDKTLYTWSKIRGNDGNAYFATFDVVDAELLMEYTTDVDSIAFSINKNTGELEVDR